MLAIEFLQLSKPSKFRPIFCFMKASYWGLYILLIKNAMSVKNKEKMNYIKQRVFSKLFWGTNLI